MGVLVGDVLMLKSIIVCKQKSMHSQAKPEFNKQNQKPNRIELWWQKPNEKTKNHFIIIICIHGANVKSIGIHIIERF